MKGEEQIKISELCWYAIQTKPRQEDLAEVHLQRAGIHTFNPQWKRKKRFMGYLQYCLSPLFPGYIFAQFDMRSAFRLVTYSMGVKKIVGDSDAPWPVDPSIIDLIQSRLRDNWYAQLDEPALRLGDQVLIQEGPLSGLKGIFERETSDAERVVVLLTAIEYQARVLVAKRDLAAA